jgi:tRNA(adenine34) deaminase
MDPHEEAPAALREAPAALSGDIGWMRQALLEADLAPPHGDVPIGCIVVDGAGEELARAHNRREVDADPTAHAELLALREAARRLGQWRLEGASVYVTLEPCPMCAGALVNARVRRLVYGASDPKAGAVSTLYALGADSRLNHRFETRSGVLAEESAQRLQAFFRTLRQAGEK